MPYPEEPSLHNLEQWLKERGWVHRGGFRWADPVGGAEMDVHSAEEIQRDREQLDRRQGNQDKPQGRGS